ncbi:MAG TPA: hypothetical protein VF889_08940, partial [Bacteroidota bacterium]
TPFPGTPIYTEMERQGRICDRDWAHYDFRHVVFEPLHMSRQMLQAGHDWLLTNFYSAGSILRRIACEQSYLDPGTVMRSTLPLNIGYRMRLKNDGTWTRRVDLSSFEGNDREMYTSAAAKPPQHNPGWSHGI